jgi:hypothetical protein
VLSSLKPNFDSSKSYMEEAEEISKRTDLTDVERSASWPVSGNFLLSLLH